MLIKIFYFLYLYFEFFISEKVTEAKENHLKALL